MTTPETLQGALGPIVRQAVQHLAGILLGAGVLSENEIAAVAGLVMALGNVVWMLVARAKAAQVPPPEAP